MEKIKEFIMAKKLVVVLIVIIIALSGVLIYRLAPKKSVSENEANKPAETIKKGAAATATSAAPAVKTTTQTQATVKKTATVTTVASGIKMITPSAGESWTFGKIHTIRWSAEPGVKGSIQLLDASTYQIVGWITPEISPSQTYFDWDTKMVSVGRMDPSKKDVAMGNYVIKIVFDSLKAPVQSAAVSVISSANENIFVYNAAIQNGIFVPNFITIKLGDKIAIVNGETALRTIQMNNIPLAVLAKNSAYVFEPKATGTFELRLKEQILAKLTVVAQ